MSTIEKGPSPFLSGTNIQYAWDSTSLGWFKSCPRLYYYHMVEGWRSRGESVHLRFGIHYHHGLERYDHLRAEGQSHDDSTHQVVRELLEATYDRDESGGRPWESGHHLKTRETLIRSVIWYVEQFRDDPAKTIILASGKPAVELSFRLQIADNFVISGHLDRVVEYQGQNYVMDRKTSSSTISSYYFDRYSPDNQMSLYTFAAAAIYKAPVHGVIIDAVQIAVGFSRFARGMVYRTNDQSQEWLDEAMVWIGQAAVYAQRNQWPMNDKSCHNYGGCVFREVCASDARIRRNILETKFVREPWNPLDVR